MGVEEKRVRGGLRDEEGFEESVVEEGIRVGKSGEEFESIVDVTVFGEGTEREDWRHGVVV